MLHKRRHFVVQSGVGRAAHDRFSRFGVVSPHRVQGETIPVVEDEEAVRSVARRILERAGYRVLTAEGGAEAAAFALRAMARCSILNVQGLAEASA